MSDNKPVNAYSEEALNMLHNTTSETGFIEFQKIFNEFKPQTEDGIKYAVFYLIRKIINQQHQIKQMSIARKNLDFKLNVMRKELRHYGRIMP